MEDYTSKQKEEILKPQLNNIYLCKKIELFVKRYV